MSRACTKYIGQQVVWESVRRQLWDVHWILLLLPHCMHAKDTQIYITPFAVRLYSQRLYDLRNTFNPPTSIPICLWPVYAGRNDKPFGLFSVGVNDLLRNIREALRVPGSISFAAILFLFLPLLVYYYVFCSGSRSGIFFFLSIITRSNYLSKYTWFSLGSSMLTFRVFEYFLSASNN